MPTFADRLSSHLSRHSLSDTQASAYLGASVSTVRKWSKGTRAPSGAAERLLDVLEALEALSPTVHAGLLPRIDS